MAVFGLTGDFSGGKTTTAKLFKCLGAKVFDADGCVHGFYRNKNSLEYKKIAKTFPQVISKGKIDVKILGKIVFSNKKELKKLENIIHPPVISVIKNWAKDNEKKKGIFIAEIPLLFEKKLQKLFSGVIVVTTKKDILIKRIVKTRLLTKEEAKRRLDLLDPIKAKIKEADYVIFNNTTKADLEKNVRLLWDKLKEVRKY